MLCLQARSQPGLTSSDSSAARAAATLSEAARKQKLAKGGGKRYMRQSALRQHWPKLVQEFEAKVAKQRADAARRDARK